MEPSNGVSADSAPQSVLSMRGNSTLQPDPNEAPEPAPQKDTTLWQLPVIVDTYIPPAPPSPGLLPPDLRPPDSFQPWLFKKESLSRLHLLPATFGLLRWPARWPMDIRDFFRPWLKEEQPPLDTTAIGLWDSWQFKIGNPVDQRLIPYGCENNLGCYPAIPLFRWDADWLDR